MKTCRSKREITGMPLPESTVAGIHTATDSVVQKPLVTSGAGWEREDHLQQKKTTVTPVQVNSRPPPPPLRQQRMEEQARRSIQWTVSTQKGHPCLGP